MSHFPSLFKKGEKNQWLAQLRQSSLESFENLGFPTSKNEDWKYTNLSRLSQIQFRLGDGENEKARKTVEPYLRNENFVTECRLVFVNGQFSQDLSFSGKSPSGTVMTSLAEGLEKHPDIIKKYLNSVCDVRSQAFAALNTAFLRDGAFIYLPQNTVLKEPIHLVFFSSGKEVVSFPRNLVIAEGGAEATVIETYAGEGQNYFTNSMTEIIAGPNSEVRHYKIQNEAMEAFHIGSVCVRQGRDSRFFSHLMSVGGHLVRNDIEVKLADEGGMCHLNGLFAARDRQHVDNRTFIDHAHPHCESHELYKGILDGQARGVFNGKILVRADAQKTDAHQTNRNLLLSEGAHIDTKPQLAIYADDVKCTHGASIGQLDKDAVFYLRSRGIDENSARQILTRAFAHEMIDDVSWDQGREQFNKLLNSWFNTQAV